MNFKDFLEFNYPGFRDMRFGNRIQDKESPGVLAHIGSDAITSTGNLFKKRMGAGFPTYGSGYHDYFGGLKNFHDNKEFFVISRVPYDRTKDNWRQTGLMILKKEGIKKIPTRQDIVDAAQKLGVNVLKGPDKTEEEYNQEGYVDIIYKYRLNRDKNNQYQQQRGIE